MSIAFGSLHGPVWFPPLLNIFSSSLFSPVCGAPTYQVICPPFPPYDPPLYPPLGCAFPPRRATFLPNIFSSALLCLWFLSNLTALSCHSPIVVGSSSALASFLLIALFNPLLNSSMRGHPL